MYFGPNGLDDWDQSAQWRCASGHLTTDEQGATLHGDLHIPAKANIELELSWKGSKPDFLLAIGVNESEESIEQAFRIEVWDDYLVVVREAGREATRVPGLSGPGFGSIVCPFRGRQAAGGSKCEGREAAG
jgi:hypothetical protein